MLLKEKYYNLNNLIKQKRFLPLNPSLLTCDSVFSLHLKRVKNQQKFNNKSNFCLNKSQKFKTKILKAFNSFLDTNKNLFSKKNEHYKYKQLDTYFQNIIKDQKKRTFFAKNELNKIIFKGLLSVNQKTFLFTQRMFSNNLKILMLESVPFKIIKIKAEKTKFENLLPRAQETHTFSQLTTNHIYQQMKVNRNFNVQYARLGPILFLEKKINSLFTAKVNSLSRIRNRCLLSGRSTIVGRYRLSRIYFRDYINSGLVPGFIKNRK